MAHQGKLKVGTVDSWLIWKLTGGKVHASDASNASRTMIYNIHELKWEPIILEKKEKVDAILRGWKKAVDRAKAWAND